MPLFGAYIADTWLGRFNTIWISICISITGHIILTASATPQVLKNTHSSLVAFIIGIIIMVSSTSPQSDPPILIDHVGYWHWRLQTKHLATRRRANSKREDAHQSSGEDWRTRTRRSCCNHGQNLQLVLPLHQRRRLDRSNKYGVC